MTTPPPVPAEYLEAFAIFVALIIDGTRVVPDEFEVIEPTTVSREVVSILVQNLSLPQLFTVFTKAPEYSVNPDRTDEFINTTMNDFSLSFWKNYFPH